MHKRENVVGYEPIVNYDLTISMKKTEVVYQPLPGKPYSEPTIAVKI